MSTVTPTRTDAPTPDDAEPRPDDAAALAATPTHAMKGLLA